MNAQRLAIRLATGEVRTVFRPADQTFWGHSHLSLAGMLITIALGKSDRTTCLDGDRGNGHARSSKPAPGICRYTGSIYETGERWVLDQINTHDGGFTAAGVDAAILPEDFRETKD